MATPATVANIKGTGYQQLSVPRLSPQQQGLFSQGVEGLAPHLGGALGQIGNIAAGNPQAFEQLEAPAWRQYGQALGALGARYSQLAPGALSSHRSGSFQRASQGLAGQFAENLQAQRMGLQQNAISQLTDLYKNLIGTQQFETGFLPKERPWWQDLLISLSQAGGQALGAAGSLYGASKFAGAAAV